MYTDDQFRAFSQIAYMELTGAFQALGGPGKKVKLTDLMTEANRQALELRGGKEQEYAQWHVAAVYDTNAVNGFYACVLETSPGRAVICFRGSDRMERGFANLKNDWVEADLGLLNATVTEQQRETEKFLQEYRPLLRQYQRLTLTGHSLGGNLAEYAAIRSVRYGLDGLLEQCVSLDGPGFSDEFIGQNAAILKRVCAKMKHYHWSFVGDMLHELPGVTYRCLQVQNLSKTDQYNAVSRHDTKYLTVDENGRFMEGQPDLLSRYIAKITRRVDGMPKHKGDKIKVALGGLALKAGQVVYTFSDVAQTIRDALHGGKASNGEKKNDGTNVSA